MKRRKLLQQELGLMLIILFLFGCSNQPNISASEIPSATQTLASPITQTPVVSTVTTQPLETIAGNFEVNGRSLYIECLGSGSPTIVLEPGEGGTHVSMRQLQRKLAERTTTCSYDRANTGSLRTAQDVVDDLHGLLESADVPGPFVLVGTSAGGMFVQLYTRIYPDQVVGAVAMNPVPPAHPWLEEVSLIFTAEEYADEESYYRGNNGESFDYLASSEQLAAAAEPPNVPFEMLLSTSVQCENAEICFKSYPTYVQIMQEVTSKWLKGDFSQVAAGHEIYLDDINAVLAVVERVLSSP